MLITLAAVGLTLAFSACGGDDDDDDAGSVLGGDSSSQTDETTDSGDDSGDSGGGEGYTDDERELFMNGCTSTGGDEPTCECTWDAIVQNIPHDDYVDYEDALTEDPEAAEMPTGFMEAITACVS